jgi:hypothetical protein
MKHRDLSAKPDYDASAARYEAFFARDGSERPPVCIRFPKDGYVWPELPRPQYSSHKQRWCDVKTRAAHDAAYVMSVEYYADSMPIVWPNLGPEIFTAFCGCGYGFTESTTWSVPCVKSPTDPTPRVDFDNHYFKLLEEYTDELLKYGRGNFIVGLSDFHPGGDHVAALLDPENLAVALIEEPDAVLAMMDAANEDYIKVYRHFADKLIAAGMPLTSWLPLISDGYYYIPSCDFSCMVSNDMFKKFFLPAIEMECNFMEHTIYHLDGPNALRHLDTLLAIDSLDALQWVPGAGRDNFAESLAIWKRAQDAGKGVQVDAHVSQLGEIMSALSPKGVWFSSIGGIQSREHADKVIAEIEKWR